MARNRKDSRNSTSNSRTPPHSHDAEQATLGAMMLDKKGVARAGSVLGDEGNHFYSPAHDTIYRVIMKLFKFQEAIDITTVANEIERMGKLDDCGGRSYLAKLAAGVATVENVEHYAGIVRNKSALRQIIKGSTDVIAECFR